MMRMWTKLDSLLLKVWKAGTLPQAGPSRFLIGFLRFVYLIVRDLLEGQLTLRAMSLVYTTLLSLVPLLAFSFSLLKAFGVHNQLEPLLENFLAPLGPKGGEITEQILGFVENVRVGVLGSLGLALLIYTVFALVQKIENALNFIWNVKKSRGLTQRFSEYLSVILIGPVLVFTAVGITAAITSTTIVQQLITIEPIGTAAYFVGRLVPYVLVCAAFTFIYAFVPNRRVKFLSALTGGIVAGVLWETTGWGFASFIASSTKYAAIYSSFAILILFLIWLYLSWLILLIGAQVSYYHQHPYAFVADSKDKNRLSNVVTERLVLLVMFLIGSSHYRDKTPWTAESLATHLGTSIEPVQIVLEALVNGGFVLETANDPVAYVPAKDIETITLKALLDCIRGSGAGPFPAYEKLHTFNEVNRVIQKVDAAIADALDAETIKGLVLGQEKLRQTESGAAPEDTSKKRKTAY